MTHSIPTGELPIVQVLDDVTAALLRSMRLVLQAAPGAGKTTLVPNHLLDQTLPKLASRVAGGAPSLESASHLRAELAQIWLVQPRRIAARSTARRIADLRGESIGQTVGYQVRFDNQTSPRTKIIVMTEGIMLRRLHSEPDLPHVACVILDEFHERNLDSDLLLGMLRRIQETVRPDLRIILMSATLAAEHLLTELQPCEWIHCPGREYPVDIEYVPNLRDEPLEQRVVKQLRHSATKTDGHLLTFLPGAGEIHRVARELQQQSLSEECEVLTLYGDMPASEQDRVLQPSSRRKIILATNIAETSITVDGVDGVIDCGLAKILTMNQAVGLSRLELVNISQAEADQRAGRAGRTGPGTCWRLWSASSHQSRAEFRPPEVLRSDLSAAVLQLLAWGETDLRAFPWLTPPPEEALNAALQLLHQLGALEQGRVTPLGQQLLQFPVEPRIARLLIAGHQGGVTSRVAWAAALLSERDPFRVGAAGSRGGAGSRRPHAATPPGLAGRSDRRDSSRNQPVTQNFRSASDLLDRVSMLEEFAQGSTSLADRCDVGAVRNVARVADQLARIADAELGPEEAIPDDPDAAFLQTLPAAFPDRVAQRRERGRPRGLMVGGKGVRLDDRSAVRDAEWFVCVDIADAVPDATVRLASAVELSWLDPRLFRETDELFFHPGQKQVVARRRKYWQDLLTGETPVAISDWDAAAHLLIEQAEKAWSEIVPADSPLARLLTRLQCLAAWVPELDLPTDLGPLKHELLQRAASGCRSFADLQQADWASVLSGVINAEQWGALQREAPDRLPLPRGKTVQLEYEFGKSPVLAARIQDLFGLRSVPRIARNRVPVLLHLLGPNMRVQQITDDLESFWKTTYEVVRKELRRRYPKHHWPENPLAE